MGRVAASPATVGLPRPRGPWSRAVAGTLLGGSEEPSLGHEPDLDDLHLALYLAYLPRFRAIPGVDPEVLWHPPLLSLTRRLERYAEDDLRTLLDASAPAGERDEDAPISQRLKARVAAWEARTPSASSFIAREADEDAIRTFLIEKSAYHLIEADPHTLALPRMHGLAKGAFVEIQMDEYGAGDPAQMHQALFADVLTGVGIEPDILALVDRVPGETLAITTTVTRFASHPSMLGETIGHLAAFEMTSTGPNARYAQGMRRVFGEDVDARFFDVHVVADAAHEQIAMADLAGGAVADGLATPASILRGADACLAVDARAATRFIDRVTSSLRG